MAEHQKSMDALQYERDDLRFERDAYQEELSGWKIKYGVGEMTDRYISEEADPDAVAAWLSYLTEEMQRIITLYNMNLDRKVHKIRLMQKKSVVVRLEHCS